jgi:hypothetical protein
MIYICEHCGIEFKRKPSRANRQTQKGQRLFCSLQCGWDARKGNGSGSWKGDDVGYCQIHRWIHREMPLPKLCAECGSDQNIDIANISQEYRRDLNDWKWLCRRCHMVQDGRINGAMNLQLIGRLRDLKTLKRMDTRQRRSDLP